MNQSMGVVAGVADMMYLSDNGLIAIEFKTIVGRQQPRQKQWQETIEAAGYKYYIVRSLNEFLKAISKPTNDQTTT
jgi:orotate phosphoribosyltransferase